MLKQKSRVLAHSSEKRIKRTSEEFRRFFLLEFTRKLIENSETEEVLKLKNILKEEEKNRRELPKTIKRKIKEKEKLLPILQKEEFLKPLPKPIVPKRSLYPTSRLEQNRIIRIPRPRLPPGLEYLKPVPTNVQIDIGKLNPLIKDPLVKVIECNGPNLNVLVRGTMGTKKTNIILSREEVDQIIKKFSETTKIPIQEGIFKVVVGKLILSAIISEVIGSKFIIKKMMYAPNQTFHE